MSITTFLVDPLVENYTAPCYPIFIQIKYLLNSIVNKKSMKNAKHDILHLVAKIGSEAEIFTLTTLIEMIDWKQLKDKSQISTKGILLTDLIKEYSQNQNFLSYFAEIIRNIHIEGIKSFDLISNMLKYLKLSLSNQICMVLSFYLSDHKQFSNYGQNQLEKKLKELKNQGKNIDLNEKIISQLLFQINQNTDLYKKLQNEYDFLLECDNFQKSSQLKMYNYLKGDWQYFASDQIIIEKVPGILFKKVDFLNDIGPIATISFQIIKSVMGDLGPLNQQDIFQCLQMISQNHNRVDNGIQKFIMQLLVANKKNLKGQELKKIFNIDINNKKDQIGWNIDHFISFCNHNIPNLKWQNVFNQFDRPNLEFKSHQSFLNLMKYFQRIRKHISKFKIPQSIFFKKWTNINSQAIFLSFLFRCKEPQISSFNQLSNKKIQKSVKDCTQPSKQIWGYIDLVQLLIQVSDYQYFAIRESFELAINKYPQLLILTLSQIKPCTGQSILDEIFSQILPIFLQNHSNHIRLLENLWDSNQDLLISAICQLYKVDNKKQNSINLSRVLDIAQVIKQSLIPLTNWNDYDFAVPLAILAGKRQFLHFQPWITDRIKNCGNQFLKSILNYIEQHLLQPIRKCIELKQNFSYEVMLQKAQLSKQLLAFIFESIFLTTSSNKMTKRNLEKLKYIYKEVCKYYSEISQSQMPDQIQQLAQRQFIKIYKKQINIQQSIQYMRKLKISNKQQEKQLFASMITFMYSELRFHLSYPQNQLMITADLFAGIVNNNLIEKKLFQILLQVLQDDLKQDNKKYIFAQNVIIKIKQKLIHEIQFCEKLIDNSLLMQKNPQLIEILLNNIEPPINLNIEKQKKLQLAIKNKNNPNQNLTQLIESIQQQQQQQQLSQQQQENNNNNSNNNNIIENKKYQSLDYEILIKLDQIKQIIITEKQIKLNKICNIFNQLTKNNIKDKIKQLDKIIDCKKTLQLLANIIIFKRISITQNINCDLYYFIIDDIEGLYRTVLELTYKILQNWFSLTHKSINDKKINSFKNIASLLGQLTLAKGLVVPLHRLNLKQILISSFSYYPIRLPLNITVILRILDYISNHKEIFRISNPWLGCILGVLSEIQEKIKDENQTIKSQIKVFFINNDLRRGNIPIPLTNYLRNNETTIISQLFDYIKINQQQQAYYMNQGIDLKIIITRAVDHSIAEIVSPIIDRAVKIAIVTTKQLIMKDFALESDPDRFKNSCYNVAKNLAGPLAQVTCRQSLKASMNKVLKGSLIENIKDSTQVDNIITKVISDNLDLGCALITKAVIQQGAQAIRKDQIVNKSIEQRIHATNNNIQFHDQIYLREIPSIVPQQLRPKIGGLSSSEYQVYDEFQKERIINSNDRIDNSNTQRINEFFIQKYSPKIIRDIIINENSLRDEIIDRIHIELLKQEPDNYYFELCQMLKQFLIPNQAWQLLKDKIDITQKNNCKLIRKLVKDKYLPTNCLTKLQSRTQQENKAFLLFQKWLETAHQQIQPFLQGLQEIFNKSQNQIRSFFQHSLEYALEMIDNSVLNYHNCMDIIYIDQYSKLIIISYKLIASNNCSLYFQHTIQAIIQVFNKMQGQQLRMSYQRAFFRLFLNLICDITRKEYNFHKDKITTFYYVLAKQFHKINPLLHPSFAFAWTELISNKYFMPTLLDKIQYWDLYYELVADLLKFTRQCITEQNIQNHYGYQIFYKGLLRIIIMLVHDYQDFISTFSLQLCLLPHYKFIQIRNVIIAAYPQKNIPLINPQHVVNGQSLEKVNSIMQYPIYYKIKFDKNKYNNFINFGQNIDKKIKNKLQIQSQQSLQIFVLFIAWEDQSQLTANSARKILIDLLTQCQGQLRDRMTKYVLNLIRYPNRITLFFINLVNQIIFKNSHQTLRNLLLQRFFQRIRVMGPHSWGMLYLLKRFQTQKNELIKLQVPKQILIMLS